MENLLFLGVPILKHITVNSTIFFSGVLSAEITLVFKQLLWCSHSPNDVAPRTSAELIHCRRMGCRASVQVFKQVYFGFFSTIDKNSLDSLHLIQ